MPLDEFVVYARLGAFLRASVGWRWVYSFWGVGVVILAVWGLRLGGGVVVMVCGWWAVVGGLLWVLRDCYFLLF